jgi:hypothetical protein
MVKKFNGSGLMDKYNEISDDNKYRIRIIIAGIIILVICYYLYKFLKEKMGNTLALINTIILFIALSWCASMIMDYFELKQMNTNYTI